MDFYLLPLISSIFYIQGFFNGFIEILHDAIPLFLNDITNI